MEYYTADKNDDILKFADKQMDLENIILSEVTPTRKTNINVLIHKWLLDIKKRKSAYNSQS